MKHPKPKPLTCGCRVADWIWPDKSKGQFGTGPIEFVITHCALHGAAPELLKLLKENHEEEMKQEHGGYCEICELILRAEERCKKHREEMPDGICESCLRADDKKGA